MSRSETKKQKKKKNISLSGQVIRNTIIGTVFIGLVGLLVGLGTFVHTLITENIWDDFEVAKTAAVMAEDSTDPEGIAKQTMGIYLGLSEEERAGIGTKEYYAHFVPVMESTAYKRLYTVLHHFRTLYGVNDVYYVVYDRNAGELIHIVDSDTKEVVGYQTGDTEPANEKGLAKLLNWKEGMPNQEPPCYIGSLVTPVWICTTGTPLGAPGQDLYGILLVDFTFRNFDRDVISFLIPYVLLIAIAAVIFGVILNRDINKRLVRPVNEIAKAAQSYVKDRQTGGTGTDHFSSLNIDTGDEVEHLARTMANMEQELTSYIEDLTSLTAKEARVKTELEMASRIQRGTLPNEYAAFPKRSEFEVYATMEPAKVVGGDFYDFFFVNEDHLCLVMADVAGKGIPAALFMMATKIILRNHAKMGKSPAVIMQDTNADICEANQMEMFVTIWLGILEISSGKLIACNAGHEYPIFRHADGAFELMKDRHNFVVGGMPGKTYEEYEIQMHRGDKLFIYTDGIPEALNAAEQVFGVNRLCEALNRQPDAKPEQAIQTVREAVSGFVQDAEQFDDMTMLCMEYTKD